MNKLLIIFFISTLFFFQSCATFNSAQYFEPIRDDQFSKISLTKSNGLSGQKYEKLFGHIEKKILAADSDTIGNCIIKRFGYDNQKMLAIGIIFPFFPVFFLEKKDRYNNDLIELGLNYYDTCLSFNNLIENSFCLLVNNKDTIKCTHGNFFKGDRDCELENVEITDRKVKCHLAYLFHKSYFKQKIKTITLIPLDIEAKKITNPVSFKKKNKLYFEYIFYPRC